MEYGLSGKCQTLLPEDKRGGKEKKKKKIWKIQNVLSSAIEQGEGGGAPIRGQRAGRGGGQSDDAMKKLVTNLCSST